MAARAPGPLSRSVAETATDLWNDSCGVAELEAAIALGAVGATANPTIVGDVWKGDPATWQAATRDLAAAHPAWTEIDLAWGIVEAMSLRAAPLLLPAFDRTGGRQGQQYDESVEDKNRAARSSCRRSARRRSTKTRAARPRRSRATALVGRRLAPRRPLAHGPPCDPDGEAPGRDEGETKTDAEEKPRRGRTRTRVAASEDSTPTAATDADTAEEKPKRTRAVKPAASAAATEEKPKRTRAAKPAASAAATEETPKRTRAKKPPAAKSSAADAAEDKPKRTRAAKAPALAAAEDKPARARAKKAPAAAGEPKPKRARTAKKDVDPEQSIAAVAAAGPRRRTAKPKPATSADNGGATPLERASERVRDAVREAKPAGDEAA